MKKIVLLLAILSLVMVSCYSDLSTEADHEIPDIVVDGVPSELRVTYGETVHLEATVSREDGSSSEFEMKWTVDLNSGSSKDRLEIGEGPVLDYKVSSTPADNPYVLRLDVKDSQTGLVKVVWCKLYVSSSLGEGLLVAYTRDGGKSSEFDMIRNEYLTYAYEYDESKITREIYSLANGVSFDGRVNAIVPVVDSDMKTFNESRIFIGTPEHIIAVNPLTFKETTRDAGLFQSSNQSGYSTTALFNFASYQTGAIVEGCMYVIPTLIDRMYMAVAFTLQPKNIFGTHNVAYAAANQGHLAVFDEVHSQFFFVIGPFAHSASFESVSSDILGFPLTGCRSIAAGESKGRNLSFLLQEPSGVYRMCTIDVSGSYPAMKESLVIEADRLDEAVAFAFCDNTDIMYYAAPDAIYATLFAAGRVSTRKVNWSPDSPDEKITMIRQYTQAFMGTQQLDPTSYPYILPTHHLQMIIVTYNEKTGEGKIYLRPFNVSTGYFTSKDNGTYGGFGEITAICTTLR